jgi:predicted MFS family arabinose efflux permease
MALFGVTVVLVSPFRAWMVDRHGPRRALPPMAAGFAAVLVAIAVIPARSGVSDAAIAVLAAAAGACAPPLGVVIRDNLPRPVIESEARQHLSGGEGTAITVSLRCRR